MLLACSNVKGGVLNLRARRLVKLTRNDMHPARSSMYRLCSTGESQGSSRLRSKGSSKPKSIWRTYLAYGLWDMPEGALEIGSSASIAAFGVFVVSFPSEVFSECSSDFASI